MSECACERIVVEGEVGDEGGRGRCRREGATDTPLKVMFIGRTWFGSSTGAHPVTSRCVQILVMRYHRDHSFSVVIERKERSC